MSKFTALNKIAEKCSISLNVARRDLQSPASLYFEGEAVGYNRSYKIMKAELERLRNKFQNNCLTIDDFSTDDYVE